MKKRFFILSYLAGLLSMGMLLVILAPILPTAPWWLLMARYMLPVALVAVVIQVVLLFYAWDPFERKLYRHLELPPVSFERDILTNLENAWSEIKNSREQIQREIEKLHAILTYMSEGILIVDAKGIVIFFNPAAEKILNYPTNIKTKHFQEIIMNSQWTEEIRQCLEHENSFLGEAILMVPSEKILHYEMIPLHGHKNNRQTLIKFSDLTQLRKLERIRADFVANVSHELRSPLTAILGFVETLKEEKNLDKEKAEKFLNIIHKNVIRLSDIVDDLLILSRVESGEQLQYTRFIPSVLIEEVLELYRKKIHDKAQRLHLQLEQQQEEIVADRYQLRQVLINLLDNAIKYTPTKGEICISQKIDLQQYVLQIKDNGMGIPYNDQGRIFERFYRVDKSRTGETAGTGLGLSIVKNIIESHHGKITLDSELGQGACFTVTLPKDLTKT